MLPTQPKSRMFKPNLSKMKNDLMMNILLSESIITPKSCSVLVTELIKYIIYQKEIIPYPYETLNYYLSKRRDLENDDLNSQKILRCAASERYFKQSSDATTAIASFVESISLEILTTKRQLSDVALLLGPTPVNPKQVFRIVLPNLTLGHADSHHSSMKPLQSLMKQIYIDDSFNKALLEKLPSSTNMYVLLKMKQGPGPYSNDSYIQREDFRLPDRCQQVAFKFRTSPPGASCACVIPYEDSILSLEDDSRCSSSVDKSANESTNVSINLDELFSGDIGDVLKRVDSLSTPMTEFDVKSESADSNGNRSDVFADLDEDLTCMWYQNKLTLKSVKEVKVKGNSVVNFWVHPSTFP